MVGILLYSQMISSPTGVGKGINQKHREQVDYFVLGIPKCMGWHQQYYSGTLYLAVEYSTT